MVQRNPAPPKEPEWQAVRDPVEVQDIWYVGTFPRNNLARTIAAGLTEQEARLIAAAPAMQKALDIIGITKDRAALIADAESKAALCEELADALESLCEHGMVAALGPHFSWPDEYYELFNKARAVVAKAGRAPQ